MRDKMRTYKSFSNKSKNKKNRKPVALNAQEAIEKFLHEFTKKAV